MYRVKAHQAPCKQKAFASAQEGVAFPFTTCERGAPRVCVGQVARARRGARRGLVFASPALAIEAWCVAVVCAFALRHGVASGRLPAQCLCLAHGVPVLVGARAQVVVRSCARVVMCVSVCERADARSRAHVRP